MKNLIFAFLYAFMFLTSCTPKAGASLEKDPLVLKYFSPEEAAQLKQVLNFFDEAICKSENASSQNMEECYRRFFARMPAWELKGTIEIDIPVEGQYALMQRIDKNLFDKIWTEGWKAYRVRDEDYRPTGQLDTFFVHDLYQKSDYIKFLGDVGRENEKTAFYHDKFMQVGDISPTMVSFMMKELNEQDMMDERTRLMMAIHYLTLNEKIEERQKAKERMGIETG